MLSVFPAKSSAPMLSKDSNSKRKRRSSRTLLTMPNSMSLPTEVYKVRSSKSSRYSNRFESLQTKNTVSSPASNKSQTRKRASSSSRLSSHQHSATETVSHFSPNAGDQVEESPKVPLSQQSPSNKQTRLSSRKSSRKSITQLSPVCENFSTRSTPPPSPRKSTARSSSRKTSSESGPRKRARNYISESSPEPEDPVVSTPHKTSTRQSSKNSPLKYTSRSSQRREDLSVQSPRKSATKGQSQLVSDEMALESTPERLEVSAEMSNENDVIITSPSPTNRNNNSGRSRARKGLAARLCTKKASISLRKPDKYVQSVFVAEHALCL